MDFFFYLYTIKIKHLEIMNREDMNAIIMNSISQEPMYYVGRESESNFIDCIIETNYDEDCTDKLEKIAKEVTGADEIIDIEFINGDDESFVEFEFSYNRDNENHIVSIYFEVVQMFK